ncbi:unnamed protein product [Miscanthus lutarioriparius]|uniref:KIB1-4 beta-propeller domain-containing protein n=1 Tax=Miscanthus lutarioriparius TaxID=422564 RepID=A0A811R410_9POAL|nr:unnamed protein product [Miscanthus lutarioriparius]
MPLPAPGSNDTPVAELWASLPEDLIRLVSSRVLAGNLLDYVRFRSVRSSWRSATASPCGRGVVEPRFHPRRWMMLPEGHGLHPGHPHLRGYIRFLNLDTGTVVRAHLPLLSDHCVVDSVDGLLVLLRGQDSAVRLVHPFTGDIVELPPLASVLPHLGLLDSLPAPHRIKRLAESICASASFSGGAITVMLALHEANHIAFTTPLDQQWTVSTWRYPPGCPSPLSFQGKLYTVNRVGLSGESEFTGEWESFGDIQVFQIDPPVNDGMGSGSKLQLPKLIATLPEGNLNIPMGLVECDSEILVVGYKDWGMRHFAVFELTDLIQQRYIPITSIEGNTLFISERSLSVVPKALPTPMGDSVVCLEPIQHNLVHQQLNSGTWSPATDDCSLYGPASAGTKGKYSESTY